MKLLLYVVPSTGGVEELLEAVDEAHDWSNTESGYS